METIEETYIARSAFSGRDMGLFKISSSTNSRGASVATRMTFAPLSDDLPGGEYVLDFVKIERPAPEPKARRWGSLRIVNDNGEGQP